MHHIQTQITINASAERVWALLMDFPAYPEWNPFIRSIAGTAVVGQQLQVHIQPPGGSAMKFRPTVLIAQPLQAFRWKGKLLMTGVFDGEHYFQIENIPAGGVVLRQGEVFSGVLVPLFKRSLDNGTQQGFVAMNEALKREAEKA